MLRDPRLTQPAALLGTCLVLWLSVARGYAPAARASAADQAQALRLREELGQVQQMLDASGGRAAWTAAGRQRLAALEARFPGQAKLPQLLNAVAGAVKAEELELVNLDQGHLEPLGDERGPVRIRGQACARLPLTVRAQGRYHALLKLLDRVTGEAFPAAVGLGALEARLIDPASGRLDATVQLHLYITQPGPQAPDA